MVKAGNIKLTLSVDKKITEKFKDLCDREGWKIGKHIEKFMEEQVNKRK